MSNIKARFEKGDRVRFSGPGGSVAGSVYSVHAPPSSAFRHSYMVELDGTDRGAGDAFFPAPEGELTSER